MNPPGEKELEHYRTVAELIYENKPKEKDRLNTGAKGVLAEIRHHLPEIDDDTARSFIASIGYLVAGLSRIMVHDIADVLERTFDYHMLAVASLLGIVDLNEGEDSGPTVDELIARREAREAEFQEAMQQHMRGDVPGQYL